MGSSIAKIPFSIDDNATGGDKAWSAAKIRLELDKVVAGQFNSVAGDFSVTGNLTVGTNIIMSAVGATIDGVDLSAFKAEFDALTFSFAGLADTTITTPADLNVIQYDAATSKWVNRTLAGAGIAAENPVNMTVSGTLSISNTGVLKVPIK